MAVYIEIWKLAEDGASAEYAFGSSGGGAGRMLLDKTTSEIRLTVPLENDSDGNLFARAAHKIRQHWKNGELPDKTCWAS